MLRRRRPRGGGRAGKGGGAPTTTATTATTVTKETPGLSSVWRVAVLLHPRAPPSDSNGNGGGGRRGWREEVSSRLARVASELGLLHHRDGNDSKNDGDVVM